VETNADLQVYDLGHLGLVASVLGKIRVGPSAQQLSCPCAI